MKNKIIKIIICSLLSINYFISVSGQKKTGTFEPPVIDKKTELIDNIIQKPFARTSFKEYKPLTFEWKNADSVIAIGKSYRELIVFDAISFYMKTYISKSQILNREMATEKNNDEINKENNFIIKTDEYKKYIEKDTITLYIDDSEIERKFLVYLNDKKDKITRLKEISSDKYYYAIESVGCRINNSNVIIR